MKTKLRILIVDDNKNFCDSLGYILEDDGFAIETAYNGKDAKSLSQCNKYDIALVDIKLTDISGTELVNDLVKISPSTEFIIITANADLDTAIEAVKHEHIVSYELKPLDMNRLISLLNQVFKRRKVESEIQKLTHAVEQSSGTIIITDTNGIIEYANPAFTRLTGYTSEEVMGKTPRVVKSGKASPEVYEELWKTIKSGNEWKGEFCNRKKNGELFWESVSITPVKNAEGVITNFIAVKDEITKRKRAERELRDSEEKLRVWLDNSPVCTKILDLDFNLQYMSAAGIKALKIDDVTKLYGKPYPFDFFPGSTKNSMINDLEKVKETGVIITAEAPVADIDGNELWFQATLVPVRDDEGRIDFIIVVSVDINDRKKMEKVLLRSEKLKSLGTITAGISHEFNNILAIITGNVQLLEDVYEDDKVLTDALRTIMNAADDGAKITSNMLKFTKTKPDTKDFISSDITSLMQQAISFTIPRWKNEAQAKGISYKIDTEDMKSVSTIMCKPSEMREIFINLINNSLDAMPGGGDITFSTWNRDDAVFISVSDNGEGMSEGVKKCIFDPFFSTKGVDGTGLGMSTVYGIVARHDGKIEVSSEVGKGTTFTMQFSTTNKRACLIEASEPEREINISNLRILVVDDEAAIRDILNKFLSRGGHNVETVNNGADAINMIGAKEFDLVLCDLAMPDVFGYDVVKAIKGMDNGPKVGIVTGWEGGGKNMSDGDVQADFYIKKPFKYAEILKQINELFD